MDRFQSSLLIIAIIVLVTTVTYTKSSAVTFNNNEVNKNEILCNKTEKCPEPNHVFVCNKTYCSCERYNLMVFSNLPTSRTPCVQKAGSTCIFISRQQNSRLRAIPCTANAYCDQTGICKCSNGYYKSLDGRCIRYLQRLESCQQDYQCGQDPFSGTWLTCSRGVCECPSNTVYAPVQVNSRNGSEFTSLCAPLATQRCLHGFCAPGSKCNTTSDSCECLNSHKLNRTTLQCSSPYGHDCSSAFPCIEGLHCDPDSGVCGCQHGQEMFNGTCTLQFGKACDGSVPCSEGLACKQNRCSCPLKYQDFNATSGRCLHRVGGPCSSDSECTSGTFCDAKTYHQGSTFGHCNCLNGTVETRDRRCTNIDLAPMECGNDTECDSGAGLECIDFKCQCSSNAVYVAAERSCLGYVGTECDPRFTSLLADSNSRQFSEAGNCLPNAVCRRRTNSTCTPVYECLCDGPKFVEAANQTCIRSPDFPEDSESQQNKNRDPSSTAPLSEPSKLASVAATSAVSSVAPASSTITTMTDAPPLDTVYYEDL